MAAYRFPTRRRGRHTVKHPPVKPEEEKGFFQLRVAGLIAGRVAGSFEEYVVALVLVAVKLLFVYQYPVLKGRYILDFLVEAAPRWKPLEVQGLYWHTGKYASGERFRIKLIERVLGVRVGIVWDYELTSFPEAHRAVGREVGF